MHLPQELDEPRLIRERREARIHGEAAHARIANLVAPLERRERRGHISQAHVHERERTGRDVAFPRSLLQPREVLERLVAPPGKRVGVP